LNKVDLVSGSELEVITKKLHALNKLLSIRTVRCQIDPDLLFGGRERIQSPPDHKHQPEFESFSYTSQAVYDILRFENSLYLEP